MTNTIPHLSCSGQANRRSIWWSTRRQIGPLYSPRSALPRIACQRGSAMIEKSPLVRRRARSQLRASHSAVVKCWDAQPMTRCALRPIGVRTYAWRLVSASSRSPRLRGLHCSLSTVESSELHLMIKQLDHRSLISFKKRA